MTMPRAMAGPGRRTLGLGPVLFAPDARTRSEKDPTAPAGSATPVETPGTGHRVVADLSRPTIARAPCLVGAIPLATASEMAGAYPHQHTDQADLLPERHPPADRPTRGTRTLT